MDETQVHNLMKLGFTDGESKTYLALIETGSTTVGPLAKKTGIAYSKIYEVLERLIKKGVVSFVKKDKTKYFQGVNPTALFDYIDKKEQELDNQKVLLKKMVPLLETIQIGKPEQSAEIFIGRKGLKSAYEKLFSNLPNNSESLFMYMHEKEYAKESDLFYFAMNELFMKVPKFRGISNTIYKESPFIKQAKYIEMRYMDFPIFGHVEECNNKILMVSWEKPIVIYLMSSKNLASNYRKYFNSVWKIAKK